MLQPSLIPLLCISGSAPIINGIAIVIINGLECEATYTVITEGMLNDGTVEGSRLSDETITTDICPVNIKGELQLFCTCRVTFL